MGGWIGGVIDPGSAPGISSPRPRPPALACGAALVYFKGACAAAPEVEG